MIKDADIRRTMVAVLAVAALSAYAFLDFAPPRLRGLLPIGGGASDHFAAAMLGRLGLMMAALWLAWPSLCRPAAWLPPGAVVLIIGGLGLLAVRPRLMLTLAPVVGVLISLGWLTRLFRR